LSSQKPPPEERCTQRSDLIPLQHPVDFEFALKIEFTIHFLKPHLHRAFVLK